jgi:hypothetical protein
MIESATIRIRTPRLTPSMEIKETNERRKLYFFVKEYRRPINTE